MGRPMTPRPMNPTVSGSWADHNTSRRWSCYRFFAFALVEVLFVAVRRRAVPFLGVAFWRPREAVLCAPGRWARCGEPPRAARRCAHVALSRSSGFARPVPLAPLAACRCWATRLFALAGLPACDRGGASSLRPIAGRQRGGSAPSACRHPRHLPTSPASSACGTRGTRGLAAPAVPCRYPRRHGLLLTSAPTTRMSLGLLPPLPRQVVGRQTAGRRVVIGVDLVLSAQLGSSVQRATP